MTAAELYLQGYCPKEIAAQLGIDVSRVYRHLKKSGITKKRELEVYARIRQKYDRAHDPTWNHC